MQDTIEIEKGANYLATAQKVSKIIKALPISSEENDKLIAAILEHTEAGRLEAYQQGKRDILTTDLAQELGAAAQELEAEESRQNIKHYMQ